MTIYEDNFCTQVRQTARMLILSHTMRLRVYQSLYAASKMDKIAHKS